MANRVNSLEERLHRVVMTTQMIVYSKLCQVEKPDLHFDDAFCFPPVGGLHRLHSLKKGDCLNICSGTAAIVSKMFTNQSLTSRCLFDT